jgi:hypothetical protein
MCCCIKPSTINIIVTILGILTVFGGITIIGLSANMLVRSGWLREVDMLGFLYSV